MMNKMDEVFKRVLNDKDIFEMKSEVFSQEEWSSLRRVKDNVDAFKEIVDSKLKSLELKESSKMGQKEKENLNKCKELCKQLKNAIEKTPNILYQKLDYLNSYGIVQCNLPDMDDYGKVIERYGTSVVEQFFLDKIGREKNDARRKALTKVLEYVKELYSSKQSPLEIAYFVRKLDSLRVLWEVENGKN